jgi:hypothetical protein
MRETLLYREAVWAPLGLAPLVKGGQAGRLSLLGHSLEPLTPRLPDQLKQDKKHENDFQPTQGATRPVGAAELGREKLSHTCTPF